MNEIWKDIEGFEGLYQVSNCARVRSMPRINTKGGILKQAKDKTGYFRVVLCKNGKKYNKTIHRLIAEAFLDNPNNLPEVNHINEVKTDNRLQNLEWCTHKYNINYSVNKTILQYNLDGTFIREWKSITDIHIQLGYDNGNISNCCRGRYKTAHGFIWRYKNEE